MTHDPLCLIEFNPLARECRTCELIAKVREDTISKAINKVQSLAGLDMAVMDATAWIMKSSAIAAIDSLRNKS